MGDAWLPVSIKEAEVSLSHYSQDFSANKSSRPPENTSTSTSTSTSNTELPVSSGFDSHPSILQSAHLSDAVHLSEVQDLHTKMLYTAGELPEAHLANIVPERKMAWAVEALGGIVRQSGFSLSLLGTTLGRIELTKGILHGHPALKLNLLDAELTRTIPLPKNAENVSATWDNGQLHLNWQ
jgi:hypothetical protein